MSLDLKNSEGNNSQEKNNLENLIDTFMKRKESNNSMEKNINNINSISIENVKNNFISEREINSHEENNFINSLKKLFLFQDLSNEIM